MKKEKLADKNKAKFKPTNRHRKHKMKTIVSQRINSKQPALRNRQQHMRKKIKKILKMNSKKLNKNSNQLRNNSNLISKINKMIRKPKRKKISNQIKKIP